MTVYNKYIINEACLALCQYLFGVKHFTGVTSLLTSIIR